MISRAFLSLVVPVYDEAEGLRAFHERAVRALEQLEGLRYEIVYVEDGSRDGSYALLWELAQHDRHVQVIKLSRNFGREIAITAGLDRARGDAVVFIDADLQDPPELIGELVRKWREGYDVVYARRSRRNGETAFKRLTAAAFYRVLGKLTNIDIPQDTGDFRLISRRVAEQLRTIREKDRFMRGLVSWVGFRQTSVLYERDERFAGETKYPLRKMIEFALDGFTSFSSAPLRLATWLGYGASTLAFLYLAWVFAQKLRGHTVQGWAAIMVAVLFLGGVQLICVGILGEYIGRIFNEVKSRPIYVVEETLGKHELEAAAPASAADARKVG